MSFKKRMTCRALAIIMLLMSVGCSHNPPPATPDPLAKYRSRIAKAQEMLKDNPEDSEAICELGVLYFKSLQYGKAIPILEKAHQLDPLHPRVISYLSLSYEMDGQLEPAMATCLTYLQLPKDSAYRQWLEGRHRLQQRHLIRRQLSERMKMTPEVEADSAVERPATNTIAVFPLTYHGQDNTYLFLGRGFAELVNADLRRIEALKPIDRLQTLALSEMISSRNAGVENVQRTTDWIGRLLDVNLIVRGGFSILEEEQCLLDIAFWDLRNNEFPSTMTHADSLKNIFILQKEVVLSIVTELAIDISPAVRDSLLRPSISDLAAFIAFSAGLAREDAGDFSEAVLYYEKSLELAPGFSLSRRHLEINRLLSMAQKDPDILFGRKALADKHHPW